MSPSYWKVIEKFARIMLEILQIVFCCRPMPYSICMSRRGKYEDVEINCESDCKMVASDILSEIESSIFWY